MRIDRISMCGILCLSFLLWANVVAGFAGVSRPIQEEYKRNYENKAVFLKVPIYSDKMTVSIAGESFRFAQVSGTPRFKVGEQLRILTVDFGGDEIKFKMSGITQAGLVEIGFKFDAGLQDSFPNREVFDRALAATFTAGLKYTDIEEAKHSFVAEQFDRSVREMAESASLSRDAVLQNIAPLLPAYREAQREIESLRSKLQDTISDLTRAQSENRKRDSEIRTLQAEVSRLKAANAALQEKIDISMTQMTKLNEELSNVKGTALGYQKEIANIQRSFNLKVDAGRDLAAQIAEIGQTMRKLQSENEALLKRAASLQTDLDAEKAINARLAKDIDDLKSSNRRMQALIDTLTSQGDSLAKQYLMLKDAKEKLEDFSCLTRSIRTRVTEEGVERGTYYGKAEIYLENVLLGSLQWRIPSHLDHNASRDAEAVFRAESIDYVRLNPEERLLLRSLGDRLKMRVDLTCNAGSMTAIAQEKDLIREIAERDQASWRWRIHNQGMQDGRFLLTARLINKNTDEIPVFEQQPAVISSNPVRQVRSHLQPIPLAVGIVMGFLLFGIVGIFRRSRKAAQKKNLPYSGTAPGPKQL